jgi:FKBP12-rapamycin complex-associated protein
MEFRINPTGTAEALIALNNQLQLQESALGILEYSRTILGMQIKESWFEKLEKWELGLAAYEKKERDEDAALNKMISNIDSNNNKVVQSNLNIHNKFNFLAAPSQAKRLEIWRGKMRNLQALGEWEKLSELIGSVWGNVASSRKNSVEKSSLNEKSQENSMENSNTLSIKRSESIDNTNFPQKSKIAREDDVREKIARIAASSAWVLGDWDNMKVYVDAIDERSFEGSFYKAVLAVHHNEFLEAQQWVEKKFYQFKKKYLTVKYFF